MHYIKVAHVTCFHVLHNNSGWFKICDSGHVTISGTLTQSIEINVGVASGQYSFRICDCKGSISGFSARVGGSWLRCVK